MEKGGHDRESHSPPVHAGAGPRSRRQLRPRSRSTTWPSPAPAQVACARGGSAQTVTPQRPHGGQAAHRIEVGLRRDMSSRASLCSLLRRSRACYPDRASHPERVPLSLAPLPPPPCMHCRSTSAWPPAAYLARRPSARRQRRGRGGRPPCAPSADCLVAAASALDASSCPAWDAGTFLRGRWFGEPSAAPAAAPSAMASSSSEMTIT